MSKSTIQNVLITGLFGASCFILYHAIELHAKTKRLREDLKNRQKEVCEQNTDDQGCENGEKNKGQYLLSRRNICANTTTHQYDSKQDFNEEAMTSETRSSSMQKSETIQTTNKSQGSMAKKNEEMPQTFTLTEIGIITSPFPLRAGTPRQGLLAPNTRSILTLHPFIPKEALDDLEQYNHVWIIFQFHLNPVNKGKNSNTRNKKKHQQRKNENDAYQFKASKIRPPRASGKKVGVFATRSPHRPNNIGLSLAYIESIETVGHKASKRTIVKLLGLDLVDGTPVYDIKPYIPSDSLMSNIQNSENLCSPFPSNSNTIMNIKTPSWVSNKDDKLATVIWTDKAKNVVYSEQKAGFLSPLYPPSSLTSSQRREEVLNAITEIVAQDPRAQYDGREQSGSFEITFCTLRVCFEIVKEDDNDGSCFAQISSVLKDRGDLTAKYGSYQHNLALRQRAETQARDKGMKRIVWSNPVREGDTTGLFAVQGGGKWDVENMTVVKT